MKIDFANLSIQYSLYKEDIDKGIASVLDKANYIMGEEVAELERALELFTGVGNTISCSNGTDALILALSALGVGAGHEVITSPFTFIATGEAIAQVNAKPVFVDIDPLSFNLDPSQIEAAITGRTRAIMPVSLFGQPADMDKIRAIAERYQLYVIGDGAQCFGSTFEGRSTATWCDVYTTSFFPAKPLGCYGDGGAVFTNDNKLAEKLRMLRVHGQSERYEHDYLGMTGRLDTIQAAVLLAKLPHYPDELEKRDSVARSYTSKLAEKVAVPVIKEDRRSAWAQYTVRVASRESVRTKLAAAGIPTSIHYPKPLHEQKCFSYLGYGSGQFPNAERASKEVISLPMNPFLTEDQIEYIASSLVKAVGAEDSQVGSSDKRSC